jgi:HAD superfamily hydrolase (TIGR01509 family)
MLNGIFHSGGARRSVLSDDWLALVQGGYHAVIFDCDGTLVNSSDAHFHAIRTAVQWQGFDMDRDWYQSRTGMDRGSIFAAFQTTVCGQFDAALAAGQSIQAFIDQSASVTRIPETANLVAALHGHLPMAVGTNSEREVATASLTATDLIDAFNHIVCISDGCAPKPAPDIFVRSAELLDVLPSQAVVFEDSAEGVRAAIMAGLDVIELVEE